jgi:CheY-like chemotaxis protein
MGSGYSRLEMKLSREETEGLRFVQDRVALLGKVIFTARSRSEDRARCLAAGMDHFLGKPINSGALWRILDSIGEASCSVGTTES